MQLRGSHGGSSRYAPPVHTHRSNLCAHARRLVLPSLFLLATAACNRGATGGGPGGGGNGGGGSGVALKAPQEEAADTNARKFLGAISANDAPAAYALMDEEYRAAVPLERFQASVGHNPYLHGVTEFSYGRSATRGETREIDGYVKRAAGKADVPATFVFTSDAKILGVSIAELPAIPSPGG